MRKAAGSSPAIAKHGVSNLTRGRTGWFGRSDGFLTMTKTEIKIELDEAVWDAWIKKNKAQDTLGFARRLRATFFVVVPLIVAALFWRFTG
jgi:hypothetical protein